MIARIFAEGFKVPRLDVALGRSTLVRGRVGAGKSAIADAIRFAALGYVPSVGKDETANAKLVAGGGRLARAVATCDDGRTFGRSVARNGDKWTTENEASWLDPLGTNRTARSAAIVGEFGATPEEAEQNLDVMRLLATSGKELAAAVERLLDAGGLSTEARVLRGLELWKARVDAERPTVDGLRAALDPASLDALERIEPQFAAYLKSGIVAALQWAKDAKLRAAQDNKAALASKLPLEERLAELAAPAASAAKLAAERATAADKRAAAAARLDMVAKAAAERENAAADLARAAGALSGAADRLERERKAAAVVEGLRASLDAIVEPVDPPTYAVARVDEAALAEALRPCEEERARLRASIPPEVALWEKATPDPERLRVAQSAELEALTLEAQAAAVVLPAVPETYREELDVVAAEKAERLAAESPWREVEAIAGEIEAMSGRDAEGPHPIVDRLRTLARKHGGDVEAIRAASVSARKALIAAMDAREEAGAAAQAAEAQAAELRAKAAEVRRSAQAIRDGAVREAEAEDARRAAAWRAARDARTALVNSIDEQLAAVQLKSAEIRRAADEAVRALNAERVAAFNAARAEVDKARAAAQSERGRIRAEIDRLEAAVRVAERIDADVRAAYAAAAARVEGGAAALPVDVEAARAEIVALDADLVRLDAALKVAKNADGLRDEIARARDAAVRAAADRDVFAAAQWAAERLRDEDMRARAGGLEARMARFLDAAGRAERPWLRCAKGAAAFGWRTADGAEVAVEALSGGQAVLFRAALAYAVLCTRAPRERLLVVELAECGDGATDAAVLRALAAVSGDVQAIACSCVPVEAPEGFVVVDVEREAAVPAVAA